MPPTWLTVLAWISLASAFVCAGVIAVDIFARGFRQHVWIMNLVWPLTALYSGPLGWLAYRRWGRLNSPSYREQSGVRGHYPFSVSVGISDTHCGAGCALGDMIGEWVLFAVGATIAGVALWPEYLADFALAFVFGIGFQYFAIVPMRRLGFRDGVIAALKSDTLSVITFEIGLFGWMALMFFVFFHRPSSEAEPRRVLVSHAGRDASRLRDLVSGKQLADQARDQGGNVTGGSGRHSAAWTMPIVTRKQGGAPGGRPKPGNRHKRASGG